MIFCVFHHASGELAGSGGNVSSQSSFESSSVPHPIVQRLYALSDCEKALSAYSPVVSIDPVMKKILQAPDIRETSYDESSVDETVAEIMLRRRDAERRYFETTLRALDVMVETLETMKGIIDPSFFSGAYMIRADRDARRSFVTQEIEALRHFSTPAFRDPYYITGQEKLTTLSGLFDRATSSESFNTNDFSFYFKKFMPLPSRGIRAASGFDKLYTDTQLSIDYLDDVSSCLLELAQWDLKLVQFLRSNKSHFSGEENFSNDLFVGRDKRRLKTVRDLFTNVKYHHEFRSSLFDQLPQIFEACYAATEKVIPELPADLSSDQILIFPGPSLK